MAMNTLRKQLRSWLGIEVIESRANDAIALAQENANERANAAAALSEMRKLAEQVSDPKKVPIRTTNSRQFRALIEQENTNGL